MNRLTTHLPFRAPSAMQWIMLVAVVMITSFMALASNAEAKSPYLNSFSQAQTISHCGILKNRNSIYSRKTRPYSNHTNTKIIQNKLVSAGFEIGASGSDGLYGKDTKQAVVKFQTRYGLQKDGVVGIETSRILAYVTHPHRNVRKCTSTIRSGYDS